MKVLVAAAREAVNLAVLGVSAVGALAFASWPVAALGGAAYAALVATDVSSARFRRRVLRDLPRRIDPDTLTDDTVRRAVVAIFAARADVERVVDKTPARIRRNISTTLAAIDELEAHAGVLGRRADELAAFLASTDADACGEALALANRARATSDPAARADYEAAAAASTERARALADLGRARERTLAHLAKIAATIKTVPSKLVRLRALDAEASDALTGDVGAELDRMNIDLRAFEQTLESVLEVHA